MDGAFYQFKAVNLDEYPALTVPQILDPLGKEGWNIAGVIGHVVLMQRLVLPEQPAEAPPVSEDLPDDIAEPLCGCGCGDTVRVTLAEYRAAQDQDLVYYLPDHGPSPSHDKPYTSMPRRRVVTVRQEVHGEDPAVIAKAVRDAIDDSLSRPTPPVR